MSHPVAPTGNLERIAVFSPGMETSPDLWAEVHEQVQRHLAPLERDVRQKVADVQVAEGRTKGDRFYLCSYRTFSIPGSGFDPVVGGLTFKPGQQGIIIEADVSGEQLGDCISCAPTKTVANSRQELLTAAAESARGLCQSAEAVATALKDPSRNVS